MTSPCLLIPFSVLKLRAPQWFLLFSILMIPGKTATTCKGLSGTFNFARFYACLTEGEHKARVSSLCRDNAYQLPCAFVSRSYFGPDICFGARNLSVTRDGSLDRGLVSAAQFERRLKHWEAMRKDFCLRVTGGGACLGFSLDRENEANLRLIRAAKKGKLEKIRKFVQMGADVNFINEEHQCAILKAAECGHKDAVDLLAVLGADMNFTDKRRSSILHYAAYNGHTHTVETIAKNASWLVNASNNFGYTPLQYAAADGRVKTVIKLLQFGADVNHHDKMQWTALHRAAAGGHIETIRVLIRSGADVHGAERGIPWTSKCWMRSHGCAGAAGYKYTPLHEAVWCEQLEAARVLIDHGAGDAVRDVGGRRDSCFTQM